MAGRLLTPGEEAVHAASSILISGGVVLYPSDTVYGLLADGLSEAVCRRLMRIKGYSCTRPFILLVPSVETALILTSEPSVQKEMERYWPGPVTLVVPASDEVPDHMVGDSGGVALRMPDDQYSRSVLEGTGLLLASTSANIAGGKTPLSLEEVPEAILEEADLVVDGGMLSERTPSMILDVTGGTAVRLR